MVSDAALEKDPSEPWPPLDRPVLILGGESVSYGELLLVGVYLGLLERILARAAHSLAVLRSDPNIASPGAVRAAATAFRRARHLESGEDLKRWLAGRGLELADFENYLRRLVAASSPVAESETSTWTGELTAGLLMAEMTFENSWRGLADAAVRLYGAECLLVGEPAEGPETEGLDEGDTLQRLQLFGRFDKTWCGDRLAVWRRRAAALEQVEKSVPTAEAIAARLLDHSIEWTSFSYDEVTFSSADAAKEGLLLAREDRLVPSEIARRAGARLSTITCRREELSLGLAAILEGVAEGEAAGPVVVASGVAVVWLRARQRPAPEDPESAARAAAEIVEEALGRAVLGAVRELDHL